MPCRSSSQRWASAWVWARPSCSRASSCPRYYIHTHTYGYTELYTYAHAHTWAYIMHTPRNINYQWSMTDDSWAEPFRPEFSLPHAVSDGMGWDGTGGSPAPVRIDDGMDVDQFPVQWAPDSPFQHFALSYRKPNRTGSGSSTHLLVRVHGTVAWTWETEQFRTIWKFDSSAQKKEDRLQRKVHSSRIRQECLDLECFLG